MSSESPDRRGCAAPLPKVLIVDDLDLNRALVARVLGDLCQPLVAASGREALQLAMSEQPDLILLDVRMPELGGFEVCRLLKADPATAEIAVVFLTAADDEANEEAGLNLGAVDYVAKPFRPPILRARVRNLLVAQAQRAQLARLSQQDGLTGIANRRCFDEVLERDWKHLMQLGQPLGILLVDVDAFKAFNDTYGHSHGDDALRRVAHCLDQGVRRETDLAARYGGEEFACILPYTDAEGLALVGETVRAAVAALGIVHGGSPVAPHLTVSIGGASVVPSAAESPVALIEVADRCLYAAKNGGRDRVAVAAGSLLGVQHQGCADQGE